MKNFNSHDIKKDYEIKKRFIESIRAGFLKEIARLKKESHFITKDGTNSSKYK